MPNESAWWKYAAPGSSVTACLPALMRSGSTCAASGAWPMPSIPFSVCRMISRSVGQEVRHERRGADPEVDVRALGDVGGDALREFVAADARGHWSTSGRCEVARRRSGERPALEVDAADERAAVEPGALPDRDDAVDEDAGCHDGLGVERPERHDLVDLHDRRGRGRRHDRPEVARRLAVDEVAPAVGPAAR